MGTVKVMVNYLPQLLSVTMVGQSLVLHLTERWLGERMLVQQLLEPPTPREVDLLCVQLREMWSCSTVRRWDLRWEDSDLVERSSPPLSCWETGWLWAAGTIICTASTLSQKMRAILMPQICLKLAKDLEEKESLQTHIVLPLSWHR